MKKSGPKRGQNYNNQKNNIQSAENIQLRKIDIYIFC